jgi:hypothetical protein
VTPAGRLLRLEQLYPFRRGLSDSAATGHPVPLGAGEPSNQGRSFVRWRMRTCSWRRPPTIRGPESRQPGDRQLQIQGRAAIVGAALKRPREARRPPSGDRGG